MSETQVESQIDEIMPKKQRIVNDITIDQLFNKEIAFDQFIEALKNNEIPLETIDGVIAKEGVSLAKGILLFFKAKPETLFEQLSSVKSWDEYAESVVTTDIFKDFALPKIEEFPATQEVVIKEEEVLLTPDDSVTKE
jgi:hypothetical protein